MIFLENFRIAFKAIYANKMRSILTTLGIIIGVAAVVAVVSIVQGLSFVISSELGGVGATYIEVFPEHDPNNPDFFGRDIKLDLADAEAVLRNCPAVEKLTPILYRGGWINYGGKKWSGTVLGVNEHYMEIINHYTEKGRFITNDDLQGRRHVAAVGETIVKELGLGPDPVGKEILVGSNPLTVVGVMEKKGKFFGQDRDSNILIPFTTSVMIYGESAARQMVLEIKARSPEVAEAAKDQITETLRKTHRIPEGKPNDFRVMMQEEILKIVGGILGTTTLVVGAVVGIALLVGGIGIMNIMLVSVTERTKEIGLRKAVGARRRDILLQFLIEAVSLSVVGGAIGLVLGYGLGIAGAKAIPNYPDAHVPLWAVFLALGFAASVGIFFGIYPAAKASRLHPIEALRYE
jgi:putative ABC transport system permease protein